MDTDRFRDGHTVPTRYLMAVTTILSIASLVARHKQKIKWINEYFNLALKREKHHAARSLHYYYNQAIMGDSDDLMQSRKDVLIKQKKLINKTFVVECLILIVQPLPFYERFFVMECINLKSIERQFVMYYLCDFILVFMFLRLMFLARSIMNYSIYTDAFSKKLCRNTYGFTSGNRFTLKV